MQSNFSAVQNFFQGTNSNGFAASFTSQLNTMTDPTNGAFTVDLSEHQERKHRPAKPDRQFSDVLAERDRLGSPPSTTRRTPCCNSCRSSSSRLPLNWATPVPRATVARMKRTPTERAYMTAAVENASAAGLVVILFDLLINDLKNAIAAMESGDIEKRTAELKHGFLVLQQLQESVDMENGGDAAKTFLRLLFRDSMQDAGSAAAEEPRNPSRQIELLLDVRQAWQQVSTPSPVSAPTDSMGSPISPAKHPSGRRKPAASWTAVDAACQSHKPASSPAISGNPSG